MSAIKFNIAKEVKKFLEGKKTRSIATPCCTSSARIISKQLTNPARKQRKIMKIENKPYTVAEVAGLTGFSRQTVTRMFENEKGVLMVERSEKMNKRGYRPSAFRTRSMSVLLGEYRFEKFNPVYLGFTYVLGLL